MYVSAILAAGGRGARVGAAMPKQLLALGDRTILQWSFDTIEAHDRIDEIVVALPADLAAAGRGVTTRAAGDSVLARL